MGSKQTGIGLYEFLIESELQHYYNAIKNDLKVQSVSQLKYVTDDDLNQIGMSRPEVRRLKKFFQKHCPQTYLAKMKKKLLYRRDDAISVASLSNYAQNTPGRMSKSITPGRHIIQAESIVIHKTLGSGEFGTVQQGVWTSDDGQRIQVAIKCLSQERMENNPVEFLKEAAMMHNVDHEHIVRLYGVVLDTSALMLVTELAPLRSLLECLKEPSMRRNLSVPTLYDFAVQICDGMNYLESKRLIHRDLAARNILVFSRSKVKISDFGLSRALGVGKDYYQTNFNVNLKLPIAWCAPECINFLRFTSASDVWAYGVTLWEMFSYGFQPWAALTGQQILEAIDEPNYQRLERPECCTNEIYCQIMLKCWQHDPLNRPTFAQLSNLILECKPEQVQAIRESDAKPRRDFLIYDAGDIITVLDKKCQQSSDEIILWKGVLKDGKSGLFQPVNSITYLGSSLPSANQPQSPFHRNDSRSSSMRKGRISADMISGPQGDLKHTGHVGPDGQFFGDITFLGSKCWVPRQVVPPYKPETSGISEGGSSGSRAGPQSSSRSLKESTSFSVGAGEISSSDTIPLLSTASLMSTDDGSNKGSVSSTSELMLGTSSGSRRKPMMLPGSGNYNSSQGGACGGPDHEYHEISDEENDIIGAVGGKKGIVGLSNPALSSKSQSPLDSPRFEKHFELEMGPSLIDEVFSALQHEDDSTAMMIPGQQPDEAHNVKNELREMARSKKKFASVKPISSSDRRTLDHAIAIANELASRSMLDLDRSGKNASNSFDDLSSPRTPTSPSHRRKFSFMLGSAKSDRERRNYSQEAASIPDIQSTLTEEAKEAYNSLIEKPSMNTLGFLTPSFENKSTTFHFPEKCHSKKSDFFVPDSPSSNICSNTPSSVGPQSLVEIPGHTTNVPSESNLTSFPGRYHCRSLSKSEAEEQPLSTHHHRSHSTFAQHFVFPPPKEHNASPQAASTPDTDAIIVMEKKLEEEGKKIQQPENTVEEEEEEEDGNPLRLLRQNKLTNVLPLPPRRGASCGSQGANNVRHQRKHPLLIPARIPASSLTSTSSGCTGTTSASVKNVQMSQDTSVNHFSKTPPPPPPKPMRQPLFPASSSAASKDDSNMFASDTTSIIPPIGNNKETNVFASGAKEASQNSGQKLGIDNQVFSDESNTTNCSSAEMSSLVEEVQHQLRISSKNSISSSKSSDSVSNVNTGGEMQRRSKDSSVLLYENVEQNASGDNADSDQPSRVPNDTTLSNDSIKDNNTCVKIVTASTSKTDSSISHIHSSNSNNNKEDCLTSATTNAAFVGEDVVTSESLMSRNSSTNHDNSSGNSRPTSTSSFSSGNVSSAGSSNGNNSSKRRSSSSTTSSISLIPTTLNTKSLSSVPAAHSRSSSGSLSGVLASGVSDSFLRHHPQQLAFKNEEYFHTAGLTGSDSGITGSHHGGVASVNSSNVKASEDNSVGDSVPKAKVTPGNSIKIKTLQRILGSSASEQDCSWALDATDSDAAHAVKLLRLKCLLPDSFITPDASSLVSALEMSHWDVARASDFLLNSSAKSGHNGISSGNGRGYLSGRTKFRNDSLSSFHNSSFSTSSSSVTGVLSRSDRPVSSNNNNSGSSSNNNGNGTSTSSTSISSENHVPGDNSSSRNYIRPTQV